MKKRTMVKAGLGAAAAMAMVPFGQQVAQADEAPPPADSYKVADWEQLLGGGAYPASIVPCPLGCYPSTTPAIDGWDILNGSPRVVSDCSDSNSNACTKFILHGYKRENTSFGFLHGVRRRADGHSHLRWYGSSDADALRLSSKWEFPTYPLPAGSINFSVSFPGGSLGWGFRAGSQDNVVLWSGGVKNSWALNHYYQDVQGKCLLSEGCAPSTLLAVLKGPWQTDNALVLRGYTAYSFTIAGGWQ